MTLRLRRPLAMLLTVVMEQCRAYHTDADTGVRRKH